MRPDQPTNPKPSTPAPPPITQPVMAEPGKQPGLRPLLVLALTNMAVVFLVRLGLGLLVVRQFEASFRGLSGLALALAIAQFITIAAFVATVAIVGRLAKRLGYHRPLLMVTLTNIIIYIAANAIASQRLAIPVALGYLVLAGVVFACYAVSYFAISRTDHPWRVAFAVVGVAIVLSLAAGLLSAYRYEQDEKANYNQGIDNLGFTVYRPTYIPPGIQDAEPIAIRPAAATEYYIEQQLSVTAPTYGGIKVYQSEFHPGFRKTLNPPVICDALAVGFAIRTDDREIKDNGLHASPCKLYATTPKGYKIYGSEPTRSQLVGVYTEVNGTLIIWWFDSANGLKYTDAFLPELIKLVDSLEAVDPSELKKP